MAYQLPPLPFPPDALEPHIDRQTMEIHHGKHHAAYVNNLNKALEPFPDLQNKPVHELLQNNMQIVPEYALVKERTVRTPNRRVVRGVRLSSRSQFEIAQKITDAPMSGGNSV